MPDVVILAIKSSQDLESCRSLLEMSHSLRLIAVIAKTGLLTRVLECGAWGVVMDSHATKELSTTGSRRRPWQKKMLVE